MNKLPIYRMRDDNETGIENLHNPSMITTTSGLAGKKTGDISDMPTSFKDLQKSENVGIEFGDKIVQTGWIINYKEKGAPHENVNPKAVGDTWLDTTTGKLWRCTDNTPGKNKWEEVTKEDTSRAHENTPKITKSYPYPHYQWMFDEHEEWLREQERLRQEAARKAAEEAARKAAEEAARKAAEEAAKKAQQSSGSTSSGSTSSGSTSSGSTSSGTTQKAEQFKYYSQIATIENNIIAKMDAAVGGNNHWIYAHPDTGVTIEWQGNYTNGASSQGKNLSGTVKLRIDISGYYKCSGVGTQLWAAPAAQNLVAHHGTLTECDGFSLNRYSEKLEVCTLGQYQDKLQLIILNAMGKNISYRHGVGTRKDFDFYVRWIRDIQLPWSSLYSTLLPYTIFLSRMGFIKVFYAYCEAKTSAKKIVLNEQEKEYIAYYGIILPQGLQGKHLTGYSRPYTWLSVFLKGRLTLFFPTVSELDKAQDVRQYQQCKLTDLTNYVELMEGIYNKYNCLGQWTTKVNLPTIGRGL